ncbi:hydroxyacid dehydrogenase [Phenylobacterium aquaticum]|uniref:hydroxyacid dehydrogenase n=1 Tax=Phenylobacterium aquaticum TaxID=1763816 RepID=UPI001F5E187B|nr:hydroxyacid dehydrogenase [Phenylobacterium aquaticum]MCI3132772.1 hydroxyacid dehydrogenase [Phenylobacterium aquaticum]
MKVVVFEAAEWEREACLRLESAHQVRCTAERLTVALAREYADAEVVTTFIRSDCSEPVLTALPHLKLVATRSTGYDHIDLEACRQRGVAVCNVPDYGDPTVAEHAFALLLAVSRRIVEAAGRTRAGDFTMEGLRGFDLAGRTMGVIGAGRIGRRVIQIARGFGMTAVAADAAPDVGAAQRLGFEYVSLSELLRRADVVSLHVPGGAETREMISDAEFAQMKPGAVLINTARGGVVNAAALVRALSSGRLAGAGLDVLSEEPLLREEAEIFRTDTPLPAERLRALVAANTLLRLPNVVVTPHIAYDTAEALGRIVGKTLDNIEAFACRAPQNLVVPPGAAGDVPETRP